MTRPTNHTLRALLRALLVTLAGSSADAANRAESVEVTILSSNLAGDVTVGEWGFSALVDVDGRCILFDAGRHPDTVLRNAAALEVDLSCVTDVVMKREI